MLSGLQIDSETHCGRHLSQRDKPSLDPSTANSSIFFPRLMAAVSHRGFNPRPAQVSEGFSELRYLGATAPLAGRLSALEAPEVVAARNAKT
jgi:hypothetical protein